MHWHLCIEGNFRRGTMHKCYCCDSGKKAPKAPKRPTKPKYTAKAALARLDFCACGEPLPRDSVYWKCPKCQVAWFANAAKMDRGQASFWDEDVCSDE